MTLPCGDNKPSALDTFLAEYPLLRGAFEELAKTVTQNLARDMRRIDTLGVIADEDFRDGVTGILSAIHRHTEPLK